MVETRKGGPGHGNNDCFSVASLHCSNPLWSVCELYTPRVGGSETLSWLSLCPALGISAFRHFENYSPSSTEWEVYQQKILEILGWRLKGIYLPKIWFHEGMLRGSQLVILRYPSICIFQASTMTVFVIRRVAMDMLEAVLWRFITCWRERLEDKVSFSAPQHPNPEVNTPVTRYPSQNWSQFELLRRAEALWEVP